MANNKTFSIGDRVIIHFSKKSNMVTNGMREYYGKTATVSKPCRAINYKRKTELETELKSLRKMFRDSKIELPDNFEFEIVNQLDDDEIRKFENLIDEDLKSAMALELDYRKTILTRLWNVYGYELEGVTSEAGIPYTFTSDMLTLVES